MQISRRDFLRYAGASAAAIGLSQLDLTKLNVRLAEAAGAPPVLWLDAQACSGCSVSLLNAVNPTIDQVLLESISLRYHPTLMAAAGSLAVSTARTVAAAGGHILIVEGAIPTGSASRYCYVWEENGRPITAGEAVRSLAANASYVIAVGTCAAYGGVPRTYTPAGVQGLGTFLNRPVINIPGCPPHPDWIIGSLVMLLNGQTPALDSYRRPTAFYTRQVIHERCPRHERDEAERFGQDGLCMEELGCKGKSTHADCDRRLWNNGHNWCIGVNGLCLGCTEPSFPAFPLHGEGEDGGGDILPADQTITSEE